MDSIILVGMSGVGKTTIARELSKRLGVKHIDIDEIIEEEENRNIASIFEKEGEEYFRSLEAYYFFRNLGEEDIIISTGGGLVLSSYNRKLMEREKVFYLEASIDTIYRNVLGDKDNIRPLLLSSDIKKRIESIYRDRKDLYESVATYKICVDSKSIDSICDEIIFRA